MIQIAPQSKVLAVPYTFNLNNSIDVIVSVCKKFKLEPYSGDIFVFKDIDNICIGLLTYDGHGFQWCVKRFSEGGITWWPSGKEVVQILARNLQIMLWGGNPEEIKLPRLWKPINN